MLKRFLFLILSLLSFFSCQWGKSEKNIQPVTYNAAPPELNPDERKMLYEVADDYLKKSLLRGNFNGSILIAKNGVPFYEKYIGFKDIRTKDSLTAETALQIASTSKPFTAAAVLRLVEQGKLNLDAPVANFFPGLPYTDVTVKMLLNHRSGLPNYLYYMEEGNWDRKLLATNQDVINTLINWKPPKAYRAGTRFNYCNTNYVLLASIVEKVTGIPFPQYMQEQFFGPLEMTHTHVQTIADSARLTPSFDGYGTSWALDFSDGPYGDKNVYSTPRDLLKWDQAWYDNKVISKALADSAFTPYSNERPSMHNYGLGWRLLMLPNGKKVIYHHGRWHGFNSAFARLTDEKITIIILTNRFNRGVYSVTRKMYDLFGQYDGNGTEEDE